MLAATGCDDTRQEDKVVQKAIAESQAAAASTGNPEQALPLLKQAASSDGAPASHAHASGLLAQTEVAAAAKLINEAQAGNLEIARLIWDITFLGAQIQNSNT